MPYAHHLLLVSPSQLSAWWTSTVVLLLRTVTSTFSLQPAEMYTINGLVTSNWLLVSSSGLFYSCKITWSMPFFHNIVELYTTVLLTLLLSFSVLACFSCRSVSSSLPSKIVFSSANDSFVELRLRLVDCSCDWSELTFVLNSACNNFKWR